MNQAKVVIKVGGSLFDWAKLGTQLESWLKSLPWSRVLVFPGGGSATDLIREYDRLHRLGEETAHWLAIRALTLNAHFLASLLRAGSSVKPTVIIHLEDAETIWKKAALPILDPFRFAQEDESRPSHVPRSWSATSDSLAARVAVQLGAIRLILLKSAPIPDDWMKSEQGIVDPCFEAIANQNESFLHVSAINFRKWSG